MPDGTKLERALAAAASATVARATIVPLPSVGALPIARAEELLSLKVLSMSDERLQDRIDARNLLRVNADLDLDCVRENLRLIAERGYGRRQDLFAKLATLPEMVSS